MSSIALEDKACVIRAAGGCVGTGKALRAIQQAGVDLAELAERLRREHLDAAAARWHLMLGRLREHCAG